MNLERLKTIRVVTAMVKKEMGRGDSGRVLINSFLWLIPALIVQLIFPQSITNFIKFICLPGTCPFSSPVLPKINDSRAQPVPSEPPREHGMLENT
jgi:hypothetical protein